MADHGRLPIIAIVVVGAAFAWAAPMIAYIPGDWAYYVGVWYYHILEQGRVHVFAAPFGNYSPPYLYILSASTLLNGIVPPYLIMKLLAVAGTLWMVGSLWLLLRDLDVPRAAEFATWSLLLPDVVLNGAFMGQADMFWVAPSILAVRWAIGGNALRMAFWAGVAFSFKAQAVFLAPFVVLMMIRLRTPLWAWSIPIVVYLLAMLPAATVGWPWSDLLTVYIRQARWQPDHGGPFSGDASNWWAVFTFFSPASAMKSFAVGYALAAPATAAYIARLRSLALNNAQIMACAALSSTILPWLLPAMHERFMILGEILTFALACIAPSRRTVSIAALMQAAAFLAIIGFMSWGPLSSIAGCFLVASAMILLIDYERPYKAIYEPDTKFPAASAQVIDEMAEVVLTSPVENT